MHDVRLEPGPHLPERVRLVRHERELRLHVGVGGGVLLPEVLHLVPDQSRTWRFPTRPWRRGAEARRRSHGRRRGRRELPPRPPALLAGGTLPVIAVVGCRLLASSVPPGVGSTVLRLDSSPRSQSRRAQRFTRKLSLRRLRRRPGRGGGRALRPSSAWRAAPAATTVKAFRPCRQAIRNVGVSVWHPHPFGRKTKPSAPKPRGEIETGSPSDRGGVSAKPPADSPSPHPPCRSRRTRAVTRLKVAVRPNDSLSLPETNPPRSRTVRRPS